MKALETQNNFEIRRNSALMENQIGNTARKIAPRRFAN